MMILEIPYFNNKPSTCKIGSLGAAVITLDFIIFETLIESEPLVRKAVARFVLVTIPSSVLSLFKMITRLILCFFINFAHSFTVFSLVSVNNFLGLKSFAFTEFIGFVPKS